MVPVSPELLDNPAPQGLPVNLALQAPPDSPAPLVRLANPEHLLVAHRSLAMSCSTRNQSRFLQSSTAILV